jgi:CO/xanthine dehydrogenase FAD-binding subunit
VGKEVTLASLEMEYDGVFLAVGAWSQPTIGVEGEKLTVSALDFLTGAVRGEVQTTGPRVMVIGGGNVAVDAAMTALRLGAKQVTMACLESREEMPALEWEVDQALEEGVELMTSWGPSRIFSEDGKVTSIELVRCVSVFDNLGHFAPAYDQTVKTTKEVDQVILAVGLRTDLSGLNPEETLETARGLITVDPETQATNKPTIWAGGDVTSGPATIIEAIASGRRAAQAIDRRLRGAMETRTKKAFVPLQPLKSFNPDFLQKTPAVPMPVVPMGERRLDREDAAGYSTEAVQVEANRCFNCGCVAVSPSDVSVALIALDATIRTTRRTIAAEQFFAARQGRSTVLEDDELVTEILIPAARPGTRQGFFKFRIRKSIDFPIASAAVVYSMENGTAKDARIVLGAAAPTPFRALAAERYLNGQAPDVQAAEAAAEAAIQGVMPLQNNGFKVQVFKALVKRAILS